jgi:hypothetical protein
MTLMPQPFLADGGFLIGTLVSAVLSVAFAVVSAFINKPKQQQQVPYPANDITRGGYLPEVLGRRMTGIHVGWVGARQAITQNVGGGGMSSIAGSTSALAYYTENAQIQLCHGPIRKIYRIWAGERVIWNHTIDFSTVADGSTFTFAYNIGAMRVYSGRTDQPADPFINLVTSRVTAYPGMAHILLYKFNLGSGTSWPPLKLEYEVRPEDIAAACGLDLSVLGVPPWMDETTSPEVGQGTITTTIHDPHFGDYPVTTTIQGITVWFNGKANLPAGSYTITYIAGAYKMTPEAPWQVHTTLSDSSTHIQIVDDTGTSYGETPGSILGYTSQELAEAANVGATSTVTWPGGKPMGIRFSNVFQHPSVVPGSPNPTFTAQKSGGTLFTVTIVTDVGAPGSGDSGCNPMAALLILLCAPFPYGCGMSTDSIDMDAMASAAATLASERLMVNLLLDQGKQASEAVASLLSDINMLLPQVGGKLKPYLIRTETTVPVIPDDAIQGLPIEEERQTGLLAADRYTFTISDVLNAFAISDITLDDHAQSTVNRRPQAQSIAIENVTNRGTARQVANRKRLDLAAHAQTVPAFTTMRETRNPLFHPGRAFVMGGKQYRVTGWKPDVVGVQAELQAIYDQYGDISDLYDPGGGTDNFYNPPAANAEPDLFFLPMMIPRSEWVTPTTPAFGVPRVRANHSVIAATVWISTTPDGTFQNVGNQNAYSGGGTIATGFTSTGGILTTGPVILPYNDDIAEVPDLTGDSASYDAGVLTLVCEQEIMLLESLTANLDGTYTPNNLTRGAFGTAVVVHASGTPCVIVLRDNLSALTTALLLANQGSILYVKTQPSDGLSVVDLSLVIAQPLFVPANLIAAISLIQPIGSESITVGTIYQIRWSTSGITGNLKIEYSADGGTTWTTITASTTDTGAYNWDTTGLTVGTDYLVKVSSVDTPENFAESDHPFSIIAVPSFGYSSGLLHETDHGGVAFVYYSPDFAIDVTGKTSITFTYTADDLNVIMDPLASVTAAWDGTNENVTLPAANLIFAVTDGAFNGYPQAIGDGTNSAAIPNGTHPTAANTALSGGGFTLITSGTPVPISVLSALGLIDLSNIFRFKIATVPSSGGEIDITSTVLA